MLVKEISDKQQWNTAVRQAGGSFLQSWEWGEFQYQYGRQVHHLAIEEQGKIISPLLVLEYGLPASRSYFFSPRGPLTDQPEHFDLFLDKLRELALHSRAIFWRLEPLNRDQGLGCRVQVNAVHPQQTLILDLDKTPEELLNSFKPKTRYNINLAERKGVKVRYSTEIKDLDLFYQLISETSKRQKIRIFPRSYYQLMLETLADTGIIQLYIAEYNNLPIAANLMLAFDDTLTYLHGGTNHEHRALMAPQLLQWQAIKDAVATGLKQYDFFGINEQKWPGVTRFKLGFGGRAVDYPGTFEIPLNKIWYTAYRGLKKLKT